MYIYTYVYIHMYIYIYVSCVPIYIYMYVHTCTSLGHMISLQYAMTDGPQAFVPVFQMSLRKGVRAPPRGLTGQDSP